MSEQTPIKCSCGSELFWESTRVGGWWKSLINGSGYVEDTDLSNCVHGEHPKIVRCAECGKSHPNPNRVRHVIGR